MTRSTTFHADRWSHDDARVSLVRRRAEARPVSFAAAPAPLTVDMARAALIVVDMQNDFLDPQGWFAGRGAEVEPLLEVVPRINTLTAAFRWAGVPVIHLNWAVRADTANLPANALDKASDCGTQPGYGDAIASGLVLVEGTWGAESHPAIARTAEDISVAKHRLSGFRDNALDQILRRFGIDTLFYCGVNLDRCVFATLMDGCFQGYDAVLIEDATATVSPPEIGAAILYITRLLYGFTTNSANLLRALNLPDKE